MEKLDIIEAFEEGRKASAKCSPLATHRIYMGKTSIMLYTFPAKCSPLATHRIYEHEGGVIPMKLVEAWMLYRPKPIHWSER